MKKSHLLLLLASVIPLLTSCGEEDTPYSNFIEELGDFAKKLVPNVWSFLIQLSALILLIIVAIFFVYKPVKKILKKRGDYVEGNIKESEENKKESIILKEEAKKNVKESHKEAEQIIAKAESDALVVKEKIINEGKLQAEEEIKTARKNIEQEVIKAQEEIHKEIVDVAISASEKLLEREVNDKDNEKLIDSFVKDIKKEDK